MSIFRQPYEKHDHRGGLDSGLVFYLLRKYGKFDEDWLEQFPGGDVVREICARTEMHHHTIDFEGGEDARSLKFSDSRFMGVLSHPPYWKAIKYSEDPRDLSNCATYEEFIEEFDKTLSEAQRVLTPGGYLIVITGDVRKDRVLYPMHSDMIQSMKKQTNMVFRDIVIWELTATGTPFLGTNWMIMGNYCMVWEKIGHDARELFE